MVFIGFALAGASGFSLAASLSALAGFLVGAAGGGAVAAMLAGAAVGALLVLEVSYVAGLGLASGLLAVVLVGALLTSRAHARWHAPAGGA